MRQVRLPWPMLVLTSSSLAHEIGEQRSVNVGLVMLSGPNADTAPVPKCAKTRKLPRRDL